MKYLGHGLLLVAVLSVPAAVVVWLYSKAPPAGGGKPAAATGPRYQPPELYAGPPQDGLTFALRSDPGRIDVRGFAHLALYVPAGAAASTFLPKGPFSATFRGTLRVPRRDHYAFTFVGRGTFELTIGDAVAVRADGSVDAATGERVRLKKGAHRFVAHYTGPSDGPAILRVYWECRDFGREPIPPAALAHDDSPSLQQFASLRRGRHLVRELRCGRCHFDEAPGRIGPLLHDAGSKLQPAYMAQWIRDPDPARMPRILHGASVAQDAADLAAYLATLGKPAPAPVFTDEHRQRGGLLFADHGCIACHTLPGAAVVPERVSLQRAGIRFHPAALVAFLRDPTGHFPASRMPNFGLDQDAATALAAFLLSRPGAELPPTPAGDPARGRRLAGELRCGACHGLAQPVVKEAPGRAVTAAGEVLCSVADFALSDPDRAALRDYLTRRPASVEDPVETLEYEMQRSRCVNCHPFRGRPPLLARVRSEVADLLADDPEASPFRPAPDLTFAGSKLRTEWLVGWLSGAITERPRPWLHTVMPRFRIDPAMLARGFAHAEGYALTRPDRRGRADGTELTAATAGAGFDPEPAPPAELRQLGERLVARNGGLGCIQCHGVADRPAEQVFEAPGINLAAAPVRLRKEYYHRWLRDPLRIDPSTKMTRFADQDGRTGLTEVLDGRGAAQFEAIWRYLETLAR